MKKRILSFLLCLVMALSLLPTAVFAADVVQYDTWVGGNRVTSANKDDVLGDGTVHYEPKNGDTAPIIPTPERA